MRIVVHRGASEVGGTSIELQTARGRLLIDFGLPLPSKHDVLYDPNAIKWNCSSELKSHHIFPRISGLYADDIPGFDGVLISHAHPDHYGLLPFIHPKIPVFMSEGCKALIEIGAFFNNQLATYKQLDIRTVKNGVPFSISGLTIYPLLVDHSAFDDMSFIVGAEGKRLMYTGDFRAHGRKKSLFVKLLNNPPKGIDCLFLEGTMLGRSERLFENEYAVESELTHLFKRKAGLAFITYSSQNIDRVVSIYRACLRSGCTFVIDPYSALILDRLKELSPRLPQFDWNNIRVFFTPNSHTKRMADHQLLSKFRKAKITYAEIEKNRKRIVIKNTMKNHELFAERHLLDDALLIYSVWEGYLTEEQSCWDAQGVPIVKVHTSGHATIAHLKRLVHAIKPKRIMPVHTFYPEKYANLFGDTVVQMRNGLPITI